MAENKNAKHNEPEKPAKKRMNSNETKIKKTVPKKKGTSKNTASSGPSGKQKPIETQEVQKGLIVDTVENIESGAAIVGEMATDFAGSIYDKLKVGVSEAFDAGAKTVESVKNTAQDYIEKYKHKTEINNLRNEQEELYKKLGSLVYQKHKIEGIPLQKLDAKIEIENLIKDIAKKEKEIIKIGKLLDKSKN